MGKSKLDKTKRRGAGRTAASPGQAGRRHPVGLRAEALQRMALGGNRSELARELGVHRNLLYYWRRRQEVAAAEQRLDPGSRQVRELEGRIATLEGALGRKTLEADFFVGALRRVAGRRGSSKANGETASTERSGSERGGAQKE
jgi:transposase-like protein